MGWREHATDKIEAVGAHREYSVSDFRSVARTDHVIDQVLNVANPNMGGLQRVILNLIVNGLSQRQIACDLDIPKDRVRSVLQKAIETMKELASDGLDDLGGTEFPEKVKLRSKIIKDLSDGRICFRDAAASLGVSSRWLWVMLGRYRRFGVAGLVHQRTGRKFKYHKRRY